MKIGILNLSIFRYFKVIYIIILFAWISFFPEPVQAYFGRHTRIFLSIFFLVLILNKKYLKEFFNFQDWPLWLFLICLLAGTVSATDKNSALRTYFYLAITFLLVFYIGKGLFVCEKDRITIGVIICICSGLVAFIAILELYFGKNILYENFIINPFYERYVRHYPRPMSTQLNPAVLGSYLLGCLPFSFGLLKNKYLRLLGILTLILCVIVIFLTFSRGVFLGLLALLLFYLWKIHKKRLFFTFITFLVILMTVCSLSKNSNLNRLGFKRMVSGSYDSVVSEYRLTRLKMTFRILKDHPFIGIGFNHFRLRFKEYCDKKDINETYEFMIPDNMYLTFLAETGIIGTVGFLTFIFTLLNRGLRELRRAEDEDKKHILLIVISALIGLLVNMGAYELFYWNNPYMLFCLICGFIWGSCRRQTA
jgi:O-antigen ligase